MPQGWQLVYMVVRAAVSGPSSRAAQRASFSSGWAVMSLSPRTVLWASIKTSPCGPASSEPYGSSPVVTAAAAMPIALRRNVRSSAVIMTMPPFARPPRQGPPGRSEEHTSELQSRENLVCRLLLEKKKKKIISFLSHKEKKKYETI